MTWELDAVVLIKANSPLSDGEEHASFARASGSRFVNGRACDRQARRRAAWCLAAPIQVPICCGQIGSAVHCKHETGGNRRFHWPLGDQQLHGCFGRDNGRKRTKAPWREASIERRLYIRLPSVLYLTQLLSHGPVLSTCRCGWRSGAVVQASPVRRPSEQGWW